MNDRVQSVTLHPFQKTQIRCLGTPWPFALTYAADIEAHWEKRLKEKPSLFNGHTFIAKSVRLEKDTVIAELYDTPYKVFLFWRDHPGCDESVKHLISVPLVITSDRALLLGEMGSHNATGGLIYPPCGTFSAEDVKPNGLIADRDCAIRELEEETGLQGEEFVDEGGLLAFAGRSAVLLRQCKLQQSSKDVRADVEQYLVNQDMPELSAVHFVTGVGQIPSARTVPYVEKIIHQLFGSA